jgi:hypothetical protein
MARTRQFYACPWELTMSPMTARRCCLRTVLVLGLLMSAPAAAFAQDLTGCWHGTWNDCKSGHSGPLRAMVSKCDDRHYHAVFTGRFFKVIPFRFETDLEVTGQADDKVLLSGESRLGMFGTFRYSAVATSANFTANYSSRRYEGQFLLSR